MSIPREPRALMINLMYLVLTAMLALNVSAEIINAFFSLEKGIHKTNDIIGKSNEKTLEGMKTLIETKTQYKPIYDAAMQVKPIAKKLADLIEAMRTEMVEGSGGRYPDDYPQNPKYAGKPKGYKDIDITQRLFVDGGKGAELKAAILATKKEFIDLVKKTAAENATLFGKPEEVAKQIAALEENIPLMIDEEAAVKAGKPSWEAFTFGYMPVAAAYPLLTKFQNDAYTSETMVINYLADKMGKMDLVYDKFDVFASAPKPYILLGESFEAEIALGAFSSQAKFSVSVNGGSLPVKDGKALYKTTPNKVGEQTYSASISVVNPLNNQTVSVKKDFKFEVGQPAVTVSADKMNVFYIGVDNPVTIAAAGISSNAVQVSASGGGIALNKQSGTTYIAKVTQAGEAVIKVTDKNTNKSYPFTFRVKRIPDPVVKLGKSSGGNIGTGEIRAQSGLIPWLEGFDFDAKCDVQSYTLYWTKKRQDPVPISGQGGKFSGQALQAIQNASIGDQYQFVEMKVRCPGDIAARTVNSLAFTVK